MAGKKPSNNPFLNQNPNQVQPDPNDLPPSYNDAIATSPTSATPSRRPLSSREPKQSTPAPQFPISPGGPSSSSRGPVARQFPPLFTMFNGGWGSWTFLLGETPDDPLYAVRLHSGWSSSPPVVMHVGPSDSSPMLAAVDLDAWGGGMTVSLPPLPGRGPAASEVQVERTGAWRPGYGFFIEVGDPDGRMALEGFEWRHSFGDAIDALGGASAGWKLVRMSTSPPPGVEGQFATGGYMTSDGKEVVAAWATAGMSLSRTAVFGFLGTGLSGVLGERWAVMVVMSALGIWERERRSRNNRR